MHLVFQCPDGGQLWLGGIGASGQVPVLLRNNIHGILAAAANPPPTCDGRVCRYGTFDGTGVINDNLPERVIEACLQVADHVRAGKNILVSCRNGAHRSAFLLACVLMMLTGLGPDDIFAYLNELRNIVDLDSYHPGRADSRFSHKPKFNGTPLQALVHFKPRLHAAAAKAAEASGRVPPPLLPLNFTCKPSEFKQKCIELGFQARKPREPTPQTQSCAVLQESESQVGFSFQFSGVPNLCVD